MSEGDTDRLHSNGESDDSFERLMRQVSNIADAEYDHLENLEVAAELERYIRFGLILVRYGDIAAANAHFTDHARAESYGAQLVVQQMMARHLTNDAQYIGALRHAWQRTGHTPRRLDLVAVYPYPPLKFDPALGNFRGALFGDYPDRYDEQIVREFQRENVLLHAGTWSDEWRDRRGESLSGIEDRDADTAAYLTSQGIALSTEYLTRTEPGLEWALERFPDRRYQLHAFCQQWGYP